MLAEENGSLSGAGIDAYAGRVAEALRTAFENEREHLVEAAELVADSLAGPEPDRVVHVFGSGHSHMIAEEAFGRAGGLVSVNLILDQNLTALGGRKAGPLEKMEGYAEILLSGVELREGEVLFVFSNSGINPVPVEVAALARERGLRVVALTSLEHSKAQEPRHSNGKRLFELADVVIDTHIPAGDASVELSERIKTGPLSTVVCAGLLNAVIVEATRRIAASGEDPPVLVSQNVSGGERRNEELLARYRGRNALL